MAAVAKEKPKVDLEIYFDYNSAAISAEAIPTLDKLGNVLSNPDLQGSIFMIAGHTDAKGGENYNLGLSERRAEAVKRYLVEKFNLSPEFLDVHRLWQGAAQGQGQSVRSGESPGAGREHAVEVDRGSKVGF